MVVAVEEQEPDEGAPEPRSRVRAGSAALAFGSLGIVFGDIGTSPIYAFREGFAHSGLGVSQDNAYGVASLVLWALVIIVSVKYLALVMKAHNHGEGGILALTALILPEGHNAKVTAAVVALGVFGTALLYGDGLITPAISVLSAVEGFEVATPAFEGWSVPVAVVILVGLFSVQRRGTARIAQAFAPVMLVWFATLAVLGLAQILDHPGVLRAVSPTYAVGLLLDEPWRGFLALGSIFLVVTGGEALYADMGHFGRRAIALSWYAVVLPSLVLNYFGQAALLAADPEAVHSPFYRLAPSWAVLPMALLATAATVIASQALISGAFSLTAQAVKMDYFPRLRIVHTSEAHIGQVYVPLVNWLLLLGCIGLVVGFGSSSALASAYGIAVTTTMVVTTLLFYRVARDRWRWSVTRAVLTVAPIIVVDLGFFSANVPKILDGGWFPLLVGAVLVVQMTTWRRGRQVVAERIRRAERPAAETAQDAFDASVARVPGTAVYLFKDAGAAPPALLSNLKHNKVLHRTTLLVSVETLEVPRVLGARAETTTLGQGLHQVVLRFGFMEDPNVPAALAELTLSGFTFDLGTTTFFLGRESVSAGPGTGMPAWRENLFVVLNRGAASAARFFSLPPDRVFEVGTQVEI